MIKVLLLLLGNLFLSQSFAEVVAQNASPFANAPWCQMSCNPIRILVIGTLLGTIGLQILMLFMFRKTKKLKKKYKWIIYGTITLVSIATVAYVLPPYLRDGFVIGRCFITDPMGCQ